jgi:hypothetical protein
MDEIYKGTIRLPVLLKDIRAESFRVSRPSKDPLGVSTCHITERVGTSGEDLQGSGGCLQYDHNKREAVVTAGDKATRLKTFFSDYTPGQSGPIETRPRREPSYPYAPVGL